MPISADGLEDPRGFLTFAVVFLHVETEGERRKGRRLGGRRGSKDGRAKWRGRERETVGKFIISNLEVHDRWLRPHGYQQRDVALLGGWVQERGGSGWEAGSQPEFIRPRLNPPLGACGTHATPAPSPPHPPPPKNPSVSYQRCTNEIILTLEAEVPPVSYT